ncbi:MAG: hypothetical protein ABR923_10470 [Terracidiphilus sp.]|jgi:hypothetical protein
MTQKPNESKFDHVLEKLGVINARLKRIEDQLNPESERLVQDSQAKGRGKTYPQPSQQKGRGKRWLRDVVLLPLYKYIWVPILGILALYGSIGTYVALRFDLSVLPYETIDPVDPSETRFLVTNEGPFSIFNVFYMCKYIPAIPTQPDTPLIAYGIAVPYPISSVRSHGNFVVYCQNPDGVPRPLKEGALLDVEVSYTPKFLRWQSRRGGALFLLKYDKSGKAVWLPVRDMTPRAEDLKNLGCPTCPK